MISIIPIVINFVPVTRGKSVYRGSDSNHKMSQLLGLKKVVWEPKWSSVPAPVPSWLSDLGQVVSLLWSFSFLLCITNVIV